MKSGSELEADDGRDPRGKVYRQRARITPFGTRQSLWSDANLYRHLAKAEAARASGVGELIANTLPEESAARRSDRSQALPIGHRLIIQGRAYARLTSN
jgi:hypothetical protein